MLGTAHKTWVVFLLGAADLELCLVAILLGDDLLGVLAANHFQELLDFRDLLGLT